MIRANDPYLGNERRDGGVGVGQALAIYSVVLDDGRAYPWGDEKGRHAGHRISLTMNIFLCIPDDLTERLGG